VISRFGTEVSAGGAELLRGQDVQEIEELKRQGLSIQAISKLTGYDRKTIRKYLNEPETTPVYGPENHGRANWIHLRARSMND
jgi:transposase